MTGNSRATGLYPMRLATVAVRSGRRRVQAATLWCTLGVLFLLAQAWVQGRWLVAGGLRVTFDPTVDISPTRAALIWVVQGIVAALAVISLLVVVRGCRRAGRITFDAAIFVGYFLAGWLDPVLDYSERFAMRSLYALHVNSWGPYIPGWHPPDPQLHIAPVVVPGGLGWGIIIVVTWTLWWVIDRIGRWRPHWSRTRRTAAYLVAALAIGFLIEMPLVIAGLYSWAFAPHSLSLWAGHWYQYPITEWITWSLFFTPAAIMRHHLRTHDRTPLIFRGIDPAPAWRANALRLLAGIGFAGLLALAYVVINALSGELGGPVPTDMPSYMR